MADDSVIRFKILWLTVVITITFVVLSSVFMYSMTQLISNNIGGPRLFTLNGSPTVIGLLIHGLLFGFIIYEFLIYVYENPV